VNGQPINDQTWAGIRAEFTLPALQQVRRRLSELMEDPEQIMRQLVRVFIDDGTFAQVRTRRRSRFDPHLYR
jgi:hypothetical protein